MIGIRGAQLDLGAVPEESLERGMALVNQSNHNFAIVSIRALFDKRDVPIADVIVDH